LINTIGAVILIVAGLISMELAPQLNFTDTVPLMFTCMASVSFVPIGDFVVTPPMLTVVVRSPMLMVSESPPCEIVTLRLPD